MVVKIKYKCCKCDFETESRRKIIKLNDGYYCKKHSKIKSKNRSRKLEEELGINKEINLKLKKDKINKEIKVPEIKGSKEIKHKTKRLKGSYGTSLTLQEKQLVYRKLRKSGLTHEETKDRLNEINKKIKETREKIKNKMKEQNKSKSEINIKFKEEFARICEEYK